MTHVWFEINCAGSDLENAASVVLHDCVITIRATQATLNVGLVCIDARGGGLGQAQRDQQGRYNHQQKYSLHGILRKILALRRFKISLGICFCFRFWCRTLAAFGLRRENLEHPGETK
jgi:hypothetical protein